MLHSNTNSSSTLPNSINGRIQEVEMNPLEPSAPELEVHRPALRRTLSNASQGPLRRSHRQLPAAYRI